MNSVMPKLETGMLVEVKDAVFASTKVGLVLNDSIMYFIGSDGRDSLTDGRPDFTISYVSKIYRQIESSQYSIEIISYLYKSGELSKYLIWEKESSLEVTMEEVCKKFGRKVKIVAEK